MVCSCVCVHVHPFFVCLVSSYIVLCILPTAQDNKVRCHSHCVQIEADELLPNRIRCLFRREKRTIYFHHQRWLHITWGGILKKLWGGERWDSRHNVRKCKRRGYEQKKENTESPIEQVKSQIEQLSREVRILMEKHNHMMEKNNRLLNSPW